MLHTILKYSKMFIGFEKVFEYFSSFIIVLEVLRMFQKISKGPLMLLTILKCSRGLEKVL